MKKVFTIVKTNLLIYKRVSSSRNPILYDFLEGILGRDIKNPLEFFAFIFVTIFIQVIIMGALSQNYASVSPIAYFIFTALFYIISVLIIEVLINRTRLKIPPILFKILPLTNKEYFLVKISNHFLSIRTFSFIVLITIYIIFGRVYNNTMHLGQYIPHIIFFIDLFLFMNLIILLLDSTISVIFNKNQIKISKPVQWFIILLIFIGSYSLSIDNLNENFIKRAYFFIFNNIVLFSSFLLIWYSCVIFYYLKLKPN